MGLYEINLCSNERPCLQNGIFPSDFQIRNLYAFLIPTIHFVFHNTIFIDLATLIIFGEMYKLRSFSISNFLNLAGTPLD
jgi:hypothetical protein